MWSGLRKTAKQPENKMMVDLEGSNELPERGGSPTFTAGPTEMGGFAQWGLRKRGTPDPDAEDTELSPSFSGFGLKKKNQSPDPAKPDTSDKD